MINVLRPIRLIGMILASWHRGLVRAAFALSSERRLGAYRNRWLGIRRASSRA